jgi:outer membrane lipoprotein-sorting protein
MLRTVMPDDLPETVEQRLQQRLTAFRERFDAATTTGPRGLPSPSGRMPQWIGGLSMRQRMAFGGVGVAILLGILFLWGASDTKPVAAMERMAENLRQAKSCKVTMTMTVPLPQEAGKPPAMAEMTQTVYWLAPKSYRMELKGGPFTPGQDTTDILPAGKPGIQLDHKTKKFQREPARLGPQSPLMMLDQLSRFSGEANRKLGTKEINGQKAWGFEIDGKKIDPDAYPGPVEIWLAADSDLPVVLSYEMKSPAMPTPMAMRMENFTWNLELDPRLFDPTPPEGYTESTPKPDSVEEQVREIKEALTIYAEASGGHYPRVKIVYGDVIRDELVKMLKIPWPPRTIEEGRDEKVAKVRRATEGIATMSLIFRHNPDAAYYGKTVGPNDKDQVLFRWKLDDGRYQVLFGDLRSETVTAERLRALEGK